MKLEEKDKAQQLRYQGFSIKQIATALNVSKGSVSAWVRGIGVSKYSSLNIEDQRRLGREHSRLTRLSNATNKNIELRIRCKEEILPFTDRDLWIAGLLIYAGEGSKSLKVSSQHIEVANSDSDILRLFIKFLTNICLVPKAKINVRLFLYDDIDIKEAQNYWSGQLGIPFIQFQEPFIKQSYKSIPHRHLKRSEYGTVHINVYDIKSYRKIIGWLQAVYEYNNLSFKKYGE